MFRAMLLTILLLPAQAQVVEELTVILREVRVHVTGKDGQPIRGLKAEDFAIEENGDSRTIDFFREVDLTDGLISNISDESSKVETRSPDSGVIVLLLDTSNLAARDFSKLKKSAREIIDGYGRRGDLLKIVQFEDSMVHLTPFTSDRTALRAALELAEHQGKMRSRLEFQEKEMVRIYEDLMRADGVTRDLVLTDLELALDEKDQLKTDHQRNFQRNMDVLVHLLRSMPGEKTIFFLTGGNYIVQDSGLYNTQGEHHGLIRHLNAANATMYTVFFGSKDAVGFAYRNATLPGTAAGAVYLPGGRREIFENAFQLEAGPADLSNFTGGFFDRVLGAQKAGDVVEEVIEKSSHYYRLGYTIEAPSKAKVTVKLVKDLDQKASLSYGRRFDEPKTYLEMDEPEQVLTFEALLFYSQAFRDDLNVSTGAHLFLAPDKSIAVPVTLEFPLDEVPKAGYEIGLSLLTENREVIDVTKSVVLNPPKSDRLCLYDVLLPTRTPKILRYSVRDLDRDLFSIGELVIGETLQPKKSLHLSQLVFGTDKEMGFVPLNHVRLTQKDDQRFQEVNQPRLTNDPYHMGSYLFTPRIDAVFSSPMELEVFFHVLGLDGGINQLLAKFYAIGESGVIELPGGIVDMASASEDRMHCVGRFSTGMLAPGKYRLLAQVTERVSGTAMSAELEFEIKP